MTRSKLYSWAKSDWIKGLLTALGGAVLTAVTVAFGAVVSEPGFNVFAVAWGPVFQNMINLAIVGGYGAFTGYMNKNFFTKSTETTETVMGIKLPEPKTEE